MNYSYSFAGVGYSEVLTDTPNLFDGITKKLAQHFTAFLEQKPSREIYSSTEYSQTEIAPYSFGNYCSVKPIKIKLEQQSKNEVIARFLEAEIAVSDNSASEAIQTLMEVIVELYEIYKSTPLGPGPARQLAVLENYIEQRR